MCSAHRLMVFNVCVKFHENMSSGFKVMERTRKLLTDTHTHTHTHTQTQKRRKHYTPMAYFVCWGYNKGVADIFPKKLLHYKSVLRKKRIGMFCSSMENSLGVLLNIFSSVVKSMKVCSFFIPRPKGSGDIVMGLASICRLFIHPYVCP